jgi:sugar phosphate isomerase/epimerase
MNDRKVNTMRLTRRDFGKFAIAAIPAAGILGEISTGATAPAKVDSKVRGVQLGMNVPYNFDPAIRNMPADEVLARCVQLNVGAIELRSQPVELFLNAPVVPAAPGRGTQSTPEQDAAREDLRKWRTSIAMSNVKPFRQKYEDAGVMIQIVKFDDVDTLSDDEVDYSFELAKALGAQALSCEIALPLAQRLAPFAEKHKLRVGFHGHTQATPEMFDEVLSYGAYNCANLDLGHFLVGNKTSPLPFLKDHHDRITHVHIKDRKFDGSTVGFGQGDVPLVAVLHTLRDNKWPIPAIIEFEYPIPAGSDRMAELAKCMEYCRTALQT